MKKIIALILSLVCVFALFSCGEEVAEFDINTISEMYAASAPTKIVIKTTQNIGENITLYGTETYTNGKVDGKVTSLYEYEIDKLAEVSDGDEIKNEVETVKGYKVYHDGKVSENGGEPKPGYNFAPAKGDIAINLDASSLENVKYESGTLTFTVPRDNTGIVFGEDVFIDSDVEVTITDDGAVITGIAISYTVPGDEDEEYPDTAVTIKATYTYDLEEINLDK